MKLCLFAAASALIASGAQATCTGTGAFKYCWDNSGNSYTVSRVGNTTLVNGSNSRTGSNWNQQSYTFGNTTQTYGSDKQGRSWNQTTTPYGSWGTDSKGQSFYSPTVPSLPSLPPLSDPDASDSSSWPE